MTSPTVMSFSVPPLAAMISAQRDSVRLRAATGTPAEAQWARGRVRPSGSRDAARLATRQPLVANPASSQLCEGRTMSADRHHERPCQRAVGPSPKAGRDRPATPWASAATRRQRCRLRSQPSAPARWCPADPPASRPAARCRQRADAGGRRCPTRTASRPAAPGPRRSATPRPSTTPVGGVGRDRGALVRGPSAWQAGRRPPRRPGSSRARGGEESLEGLGPIAGGGRR